MIEMNDYSNEVNETKSSLRESFGKALVELAVDHEFVVVDCDVAGGTGTYHFRKAFPDRFIQVGIAEQNAIGVAAGLNISTGLPIVVAGFATFLMRAWEVARLSVDYANRNVKIIASHGGLDTGPDSHSAMGLEDFGCWRTLPNFSVISPSSPAQMKAATKTVLEHKGPVYMRSGRSPWNEMPFEGEFKIGQSYTLREGNDIAIIATGKMVWYALKTAHMLDYLHGIQIRVVDMSTIKPIDHSVILRCCNEVKFIVTMEDHCIRGGVGGAVCEAVTAQRHPIPIVVLGVDGHGQSGDPDELMIKYGLTAEQMTKEIVWEWEHQ